MLDALLQASINGTAVEVSQAKAAVKEVVTNWLQKENRRFQRPSTFTRKEPPQKLPLNLC